MLGSGINPESFKQDYSGFANAAATQAQGVANLGARIGGVIKEFGEAKKEQKKVDAYNKASAKAIEAAITLGGSYGIKGAKETLSPFLSAANDPNLSPIEKAALLDEAKAMIPNVFGRFDQSQANAIQQSAINARNAPPLPAPFTLKPELLKVGDGNVAVYIGRDGNYYVESGQFPITNFNAYAEGQPPEVYSSGAGQSAANQIDSGLTLPSYRGTNESPPVVYSANGEPMLLPPPIGTFDTTNPPVTIDPSVIDAGIALNPAQVTPIVGEPPSSIALPKPAPQLKSRIIKSGEDKQVETFRPATAEESALYGGVPGQMSSKGRFYPINLPSGMTIETDPSGGIKVVQGAGVGAKTEKTERSSKFQETRQTNFIIDKANEAENIIDNSISTYGAGTIIDIAKSRIPGTQEYKLKNQIFPAIKDSIALDSLKQLKAASPTGSSGLGSLTEKEGQRLENMYGVLDINGDKVTLKNDLKRLKQTAFDYIHGSKDEREKALQKGDITKDQNDQVEQMYREQILGVDASKSKEIQPIIPSSNSESVYEKYLQK